MCKNYYRVARDCSFSNGFVHCCWNRCINDSGVKWIYERSYFNYDQYVLCKKFKYIAKKNSSHSDVLFIFVEVSETTVKLPFGGWISGKSLTFTIMRIMLSSLVDARRILEFYFCSNRKGTSSLSSLMACSSANRQVYLLWNYWVSY